MQEDTAIVRYAEIFLKSGYVRKTFTDRLESNIRCALERENLKVSFYRRRHRIFINCEDAVSAAELASNVFGVSSASPAAKISNDSKELKDSVITYLSNRMGSSSSFAVRAKRDKRYGLTSRELESSVGAMIQGEYGNPVDLTEPDVLVSLEVYCDCAYVYTQKIKGLGGLPYGTQGALAGSAKDREDALASWMMMRRGCELYLVGEGVYANLLQRYANSQFKQFDDVDSAVEAGALGVIASDEAILKREVPVYWPLMALSTYQKDNFMKCSGIGSI